MLAGARDTREDGTKRHPEDRGCLPIGKTLDRDQKEGSSQRVRQRHDRALEVAAVERSILPAGHGGQIALPQLAEMDVRTAPLAALAIGHEAMVKDRVKPAAQIAVGPARLPARQRPFEAVLQQIVGSLAVAAEQGAGEATQIGNMRGNEPVAPGGRLARVLRRHPAGGRPWKLGDYGVRHRQGGSDLLQGIKTMRSVGRAHRPIK
jgi:hypothetical protein